MSISTKKLYFETSAVNYLVKKDGWDKLIGTRNLQADEGNVLYLSPVTINEILMTKDEEQREKLIIISQNIFLTNS